MPEAKFVNTTRQLIMPTDPNELIAIAEKALEFIPDGGIIGLGTGKAATAFIHALGQRVRAGLGVRGLPTSESSAELARQLRIPLTSFDEIDAIDVAVDGADEVDPQCNLIKGYGGALVREKIVATAAKKFIVIVGPEKLVPVLGSRGRLPVEVLPFGLALVRRMLDIFGYPGSLRMDEGRPFVTDNGNFILDCRVKALDKPVDLEAAISSIPGVIGTGLFIGMADIVLVQRDGVIEVMKRE
jgi:ribose 5-phosphate isomerase A